MIPVTLYAPYVLGVAVTWALAWRLNRRATHAPVLCPGWPTFWTTVATSLVLRMLAHDCSAAHSLYLMSWLLFWPPVLTTAFMYAVYELSRLQKALPRVQPRRPAAVRAG